MPRQYAMINQTQYHNVYMMDNQIHVMVPSKDELAKMYDNIVWNHGLIMFNSINYIFLKELYREEDLNGNWTAILQVVKDL